jgi:hypothetical protein
VTGAGLDPVLGICGQSGPKSLTWYRNGVKIISGDYTSGGENVVITYAIPNEPIPPFLSFAQGILAIGSGDDSNIYTSVVECNDGRVSGRTTFVQPGLIIQNYGFEYLLGGVWREGQYISDTFPPYFVSTPDGPYAGGGIVYAYNADGVSPTEGFWFIAAAGPTISALRASVIV